MQRRKLLGSGVTYHEPVFEVVPLVRHVRDAKIFTESESVVLRKVICRNYLALGYLIANRDGWRIVHIGISV